MCRCRPHLIKNSVLHSLFKPHSVDELYVADRATGDIHIETYVGSGMLDIGRPGNCCDLFHF